MTDKTRVIRIFETFAGIGAQHKAISNISKEISVKFEITKTSEWDARAIIAYSQIHNKKKYDSEYKKVLKLSEEQIDMFLSKQIYSLNSKKPSNVTRKDLDFKQILMAATKANNCLPNIMDVKGKELENIDLLFYSFPCQGLSIANMGRDKGIDEEAKSTSNLIWQIKRILDDAVKNNISLPKILLMENVTNLNSKKHRPHYEKWQQCLEEIGYTNYSFKLNGLNHRSLQKRERLFLLSIKNGDKTKTSEYVRNEILKFANEKKLSIEQKEKMYKNIFSASNKYLDEIILATPKNTVSRIRMINSNVDLLEEGKNKKYIINTLTTKQDRHPNIGMIKLPPEIIRNGYAKSRFITPREGYRIMGFDCEDFNKVKPFLNKKILTKESLYRQAGNSIIVSVLEDIFKFLNQICTKEKFI